MNFPSSLNSNSSHFSIILKHHSPKNKGPVCSKLVKRNNALHVSSLFDFSSSFVFVFVMCRYPYVFSFFMFFRAVGLFRQIKKFHRKKRRKKNLRVSLNLKLFLLPSRVIGQAESEYTMEGLKKLGTVINEFKILFLTSHFKQKILIFEPP